MNQDNIMVHQKDFESNQMPLVLKNMAEAYEFIKEFKERYEELTDFSSF